MIQSANLHYRLTDDPKEKPENPEKCAFGKMFTDHMLAVEWNIRSGWGNPVIKPIENISLHPATSVFHYATEVKFAF